jgi:hypothetical protein
MIKITNTAALALVLGLFCLGGAEAKTVTVKPAVQTPVVVKPLTTTVPAPKTTFGTGIWRTVQTTTRNPVTGVWSSDVQYLSFAKTGGTFSEEIVSQGGNGTTGAGGIELITGNFKLLNSTSMDITETSARICVLYCQNIANSPIGETFVDHFTQVSPTVVDGAGGLTWTEISTQ